MALALPGLLEPALPYLPLAACRAEGVDPAWWFPSRGEPLEPARAVCRGCPEREPCLVWALGQGSRLAGVWGGLSEQERRKLRRRDGPAVVAPLSDVDEPDADALAELEVSESSEPSSLEASDISPRACGMCGRPLTPRQPLWCSRSCQKKAAHRRARAGVAGRGVEARFDTAQPLEAAVLETRSYPAGISTLVPAGATVLRIEFAVGADSWTLTRSSTNGGTP
jgi:WhiB family redox-sensing transcriptional regulator